MTYTYLYVYTSKYTPYIYTPYVLEVMYFALSAIAGWLFIFVETRAQNGAKYL